MKKKNGKNGKKRRAQMDQTEVKLNKKEIAVLVALRKCNNGQGQISDIAGKAFPKKGTAPKTKGNSWVRNSLRKLLRVGFVRKVTPGFYAVTAAGEAYKAPKVESEEAKTPAKRKSSSGRNSTPVSATA